ncbi:MAG: hypothetical protein HC836_35885 [Richelia sp. RM2_1_2]|nr:hypothetical protein [Richelia sp. RM2_1_2]
MKKRITLDEQIKRLKQLATYDKSIGKYQFLNEDAPINVNGQVEAPAQQQNAVQGNQQDALVDQELEKLFANPSFGQELEGAAQAVTKELPSILKTVASTGGDKAQLEIGEGQQLGEAQISEAGLVLAGSMALAAPKIAEYIGKGLAKLGVKTNSKIVQKMGDKLSHFGHKIHGKYIQGIEFALKPLTKGLDDKKRHAVAETILTMMVAGFGIASIAGVVHAISAGQAGIAALETGLSGVKAAEIAEKVRELLPAALIAAGAEAASSSVQTTQATTQQGMTPAMA